MALVTIIFACVVGAIAGLVHVALGGTWWQGMIVYAGFATTLPVILLVFAILANLPRRRGVAVSDEAEIEQWQDWQMEEEAAADRPGVATEETEEAPAKRKSA